MTVSTLLQHETLGKPDHFGTYALLPATTAQTFNGKVAVNQASATDEALHLTTTNAASGPYAGIIDAYGNGLKITQTHDWSGATVDLIDITYRSTGDAIYVVHLGGHPTSGDAGGTGGNSCFNVLIPYHRDFANTGYDGTVVNTNTGMQGLFIAAQPVGQGVKPLAIISSSEQAAISITNQPSGHPVGNGRAVYISDSTTASSVHIDRNTAPAAGAADSASSAVIRIVDTVNTDGLSASGHNMLAVGDNTGNRLLVDSNGAFKWITHGSGNAIDVSLGYGGAGIVQLAASLQLADNTTATQRGPTIGIEKIVGSAIARLSGGGSEFLRWGAGNLGFFGGAGAGKSTVSGIRGSRAVQSTTLSVFNGLGLLTNSTGGAVTLHTSSHSVADGGVYLIDTTAAAFADTLPTATADAEVTFIKIDSSANAFTLNRATTATINIPGAWATTSTTLTTQGQRLTLISDGTNWYAKAQ